MDLVDLVDPVDLVTLPAAALLLGVPTAVVAALRSLWSP